MKIEDHLTCPPLVCMPAAQAHGYLLAWIRHERTMQWWAIITWTRITGDQPTYKRLVTQTPADAVQPMEGPEAYRHVPRLLFTRSGTVEPLPDEPDGKRP